MEDKRTAIAIILSIMVVMVYTQFVFGPQHIQQQQAEQASKQIKPDRQTEVPSLAPKTTGVPLPTLDQEQQDQAETESLERPSLAQLEAQPLIRVKTDLLTVAINPLGARFSSFLLNQHLAKLDQEEALDLVATRAGGVLPLGVTVGSVRDDAVLYQLSGISGGAVSLGENSFLLSGADAAPLALKFSGALPDGSPIIKTITFYPNSYLFQLQVEVPGSTSQEIWLDWVELDSKSEKERRFNPSRISYLSSEGKLERLELNALTETAPRLTGRQWIALGDKYFMAALLPDAADGTVRFGRSGETLYTQAGGTTPLASFKLFVGPKKVEVLQQTGYSLERAIDLGWFTVFAYPILMLTKFFYGLLGNYGLAIISVTLLMKLLFLPLTSASMKSMKAMQDLQPEMEALKNRIKDPKQLNQELMALYKDKGVNPLGGCLPMVIQIPVFIGFWRALDNSIELRHAPFALWINDLSSPEKLEILGIGIPVMILLMAVGMFVQQLTMPKTGSPEQRRAMLITTLIFPVIFIIFPFPSGLTLYMVTNTYISIVQQVFLRKEGSKMSPLLATLWASLGIFCFGFILTLL